jgi:hypothetical protein
MTVGTTTFVVPMVSRVIGSLGTNSPNAVVEAKNNLFFASTQSFNTTGAKPDMLNVLSTDEVSLAVRANVRALSNHNSEKIHAIFFDGKIFWAVPYGTPENSEIWVLDLELNCWVRPWKIAAKRLLSYTDTSGREHLLYRPSTGDDSRLMRISASFNADNGVPFDWKIGTGLINWDKTHVSFERVKKIYFEFLRASGAMDISILGAKKNKSFANLKNYHVAGGTVSTAGWNNDRWGEFRWNESLSVPKTYSYASLKKVIKVQKVLNNIKIELSGKSTTQFALSVISIQGIAKHTGDPSAWKK